MKKSRSPLLIVLLTLVVLYLLYLGITQPAQRGSVEMAMVVVMPAWVLVAHRLTK
jgi:hypothetical protein